MNVYIKIKKHKLRFWLFGWRIYKVYDEGSDNEFYILTNYKLPKYKYKAFIIEAKMKQLFKNIYLWRKTK